MYTCILKVFREIEIRRCSRLSTLHKITYINFNWVSILIIEHTKNKKIKIHESCMNKQNYFKLLIMMVKELTREVSDDIRMIVKR